MIMWRKGYPRAVYQPVVCIHGIYYVVKDEVVFKRHGLAEWVIPGEVAKHLEYDPRSLPVLQSEKPDDIFAVYFAIQLMREFFTLASTGETVPSPHNTGGVP